jgi:hypothetical protein
MAGYTLLQTQTASVSSSIDFTSNITSSYRSYIFYIAGLVLGTDNAELSVQFNAVGQSGWNETVTSNAGRIYLNLYGSGNFTIEGGIDRGNSVGLIPLAENQENESTSSTAGWFALYNPSDTAKYTIWEADTMNWNPADYYHRHWVNGYVNTSAAIDEVRFAPSSGTFTSGRITLYGID